MRHIRNEDLYEDLKGKPRSCAFLVLVLAIIAVFGVCVWGTAAESSIDMTDSAHSKNAEPNYAVVFPETAVNTMTITLSPENWEIMLANMTEL